ncbi:EcoAI/FtnUII family type I restriction enzme subunit R [Polaromonas sp.]|jgi:type I restriction enzyme R subunit|uniref:EcoAI/FtnUII family type I restriction enzme subunit R n=1 Tax=Polaromonas sp. TaxID=1869339 RepID=UPI000BCC94DE|nr:DEAD/DEAH box helicase family protein [Polaromonas sp.]OYZ01549.1 MAG: restriction endonuclease [Polaromonas sp. 28-63-22]HQS30282.1 DEAD/DEAH box helicase family protein [Polaromonas sp.]HQS89645.1 DEAD/DEAH box helicase family protein [Polaromonas sp.]
MDKKSLSESDISDKFIRPAIVKAGWHTFDQIYAQYPLRAGRVVVRGKTARRDQSTVLFADFVVFLKPNIPLAVIEAKKSRLSVQAGMQQALKYAELLDVPFSFASNGDSFVFRDATLATGVLEQNLTLDQFPSPQELWSRYCAWKGWTPEVQRVTEFDYAPAKSPRYYQLNAINRTVEAIATGQNRVLLVMATGTGKTYTAFQIIHRLWKSPWRSDKPSGQKRILFLADRNILIDQTMVNDFRPFKGAMAKLSPNAKGMERVDAQGRVSVEDLDLAVNKTTKLVDKSYEIYLSLYQAVSGTEEEQNIYKQFSPDFFDLIVVDECHRGSADEDSAWREILTYFSSATQVGLTATPKETKEISNRDYFGAPLYTYSLKQGIEDGYLAPYKVIRVDLDKDAFGWRPTTGMTDKHGNLIEDRIYNGTDMNRKLVLEKRDEAVAAKITEYLKVTDRYAKTIVFCEDIDHAARMRQALSNANADICATNPKYVVQITGDNPEGKRELDNFIDPEKAYPVIATTSKLMSTGVDAQTCKLIVLDQNIKSMTLFKQIIGRGTRLREDLGKTWFTILDFKRATELFADKDFDGEPVQIYEPKPGQPIAPPDAPPDAPGDTGPGNPPPLGPFAPSGDGPKKYVVGAMVTVVVARERVQYLNAQGQLITESLRDYTRINLTKQYDSLDKFLQAWNDADRKAALLQELEGQGVLIEALAEELAHSGLTNLDPFDLLLYVAWHLPPLTRRERASRVKKRNVFTQYGPLARKVIDALLDKYADEGIATIEADTVFNVQPFTEIGRPSEIINSFGGRPQYLGALQTLERELYATNAT